ncbi:LexA family protein [Streptomyces microflavus]|uniref:LexA family protein n=1 Tax=Streptomyces microflavus TaxID=1919 RepID=UPI003648845C
MRPLSETQRRVLAVIRSAIADTGEAPSVREIAAGAGLRSTSTVHYQLGRLEKAGYLKREPGRNRSIRLT